MQDLNNENTQPMKPNPEAGETVPNHVTHGETEPTGPVSSPPPASAHQMRSAAENTPTLVTMANENLPLPPKQRRARRWPWVLLGLLLVVIGLAAGGWMGYRDAVNLRKSEMETTRVKTATEHFMLGVQAQDNKQYQVAQAQYTYVMKLDPNFPGAQDKLREVMVAMAMKATPTIAPTVALPTPSPTKDTRPQEEIYAQARQQFAAQDWNGLFATIDALRQIDPNLHAVEIDDMLYVALRYRGVDKILRQADLEGGLYDLALAEQFGPLDQDAKGYRQWARLYLNGASFWEVDWEKVMQAYEQIYPAFPNMRDGSGMTAIERYRIAAKSYAEQLAAAGDDCKAAEYYDKSLKAVPDGQVAQAATEAANACNASQATEVPAATATFTPTIPAATAPTAAATIAATNAEVTATPAPQSTASATPDTMTTPSTQ